MIHRRLWRLSLRVLRSLLVVITRRFYFFSSRRRHTRCYRDWSSDVCSSDLNEAGEEIAVREVQLEDVEPRLFGHARRPGVIVAHRAQIGPVHLLGDLAVRVVEIGRASCSDRACWSEGEILWEGYICV